MAKIKLAGIIEESIVDGPGFRFVIFTQGCRHKCPGCQNPQTHDFDGGYWDDTDSLLEKIRLDPLLKGVTLSGGDPFEQADALVGFCDEIHKMGKDVFAYTGYTYEQLLQSADKHPEWMELLKRCDILVDGRYEKEKRSLELLFRGSSNQRLIDVKRSLAQGVVVLADL